MVIESVKFSRNNKEIFYEIGNRISYEPTGNEKDRQSLMIQNISLEPTGQVCLTLSGHKAILLGNIPYELYARPFNDEELEKIKKAKEEREKLNQPPSVAGD